MKFFHHLNLNKFFLLWKMFKTFKVFYFIKMSEFFLEKIFSSLCSAHKKKFWKCFCFCLLRIKTGNYLIGKMKFSNAQILTIFFHYIKMSEIFKDIISLCLLAVNISNHLFLLEEIFLLFYFNTFYFHYRKMLEFFLAKIFSSLCLLGFEN